MLGRISLFLGHEFLSKILDLISGDAGGGTSPAAFVDPQACASLGSLGQNAPFDLVTIAVFPRNAFPNDVRAPSPSHPTLPFYLY